MFTEEERAAFWESIGMDDPKKPKDKNRHEETEKEDSNVD